MHSKDRGEIGPDKMADMKDEKGIISISELTLKSQPPSFRLNLLVRQEKVRMACMHKVIAAESNAIPAATSGAWLSSSDTDTNPQIPAPIPPEGTKHKVIT